MRGSFWQKDSLITHVLFELCLLRYLGQSQILGITLQIKSKQYKHQKIKKFALDSQLQTIQIVTNDVQMLILCLSHFIATVNENHSVTFQFLYIYVQDNFLKQGYNSTTQKALMNNFLDTLMTDSYFQSFIFSFSSFVFLISYMNDA